MAIILKYTVPEEDFRAVVKGILGSNYRPEMHLANDVFAFQRKIQNTLVAGVRTKVTRKFGNEEFNIPVIVKLHRGSAETVTVGYSEGTLAILIPNALRMYTQEVLDTIDLVLGRYGIHAEPEPEIT